MWLRLHPPGGVTNPPVIVQASWATVKYSYVQEKGDLPLPHGDLVKILPCIINVCNYIWENLSIDDIIVVLTFKM